MQNELNYNKLETLYFRLVYKLCESMAETLISKYNFEFTPDDVPFVKKMLKIHKAMVNHEKVQKQINKDGVQISNSIIDIIELFNMFMKTQKLPAD